MSLFAGLTRGDCALGVAGGIMTAAQAGLALSNDADYVAIGKAGIISHDLPKRITKDVRYPSPKLPVSPDDLRLEGLGFAFIDYPRGQRRFVEG